MYKYDKSVVGPKHHSLALYTQAACVGIYRSSQGSSIELLLLQAHPPLSPRISPHILLLIYI